MLKFFKKTLDKSFFLWYYNQAMRFELAGVAELADAQDLKSCGIFSRTGSIPVSGTTLYV